MTAHEALRKGPAKFAEALNSLTGGKAGLGPPAVHAGRSSLRRNMQVEIRAQDNKMYPGKITKMPDLPLPAIPGQAPPPLPGFTVAYDDGTEETDVEASRLRPAAPALSGGVLFLDEAYDLDPATSADGRAILADIMSAAEEHRHSVTIILAGYKDDVEKRLYGFNQARSARLSGR